MPYTGHRSAAKAPGLLETVPVFRQAFHYIRFEEPLAAKGCIRFARVTGIQ